MGMTLRPAEDFMYATLKERAATNQPCPTCDEWLDLLSAANIKNFKGEDFRSVSGTVYLLQRLECKGLIAVDRWQRTRKVTIIETGEATMEPDNQTPHWRTQPRNVPCLSPDQVKARAPGLSEQIFKRAQSEGFSPSDYLARLTWLGWQVENGQYV